MLSELQRRLREHYRNEFSTICYIPSCPHKDVDVRDIYVPPKILKKDHRQINEDAGTTVKSFSDIFYNEKGRCKNVYVVGEAGSGKSLFSQNIALLWSQEGKVKDSKLSTNGSFSDVDIIKNFEFVFHLSLRDSCQECDYVNMIRDQLLYKLYGGKQIEKARELVEDILDTSLCLIAADGLDEWTHPDTLCKCLSDERGKTPLIHSRHKATILLSSRPWRLSKNRVKDSKIDKYFEIEGAEDVERLGTNVVRILNENTGRKRAYCDFETFVQGKAICGSLFKSPILLLHTICLWHEGRNLANSLSEIYASIFDMLIGRIQSATQPEVDMNVNPCKILSNLDNINKHWDYFVAISKVAFEMLLPTEGHSTVVFSSNACDTDVKQFAIKCGILTEKNPDRSVANLLICLFSIEPFKNISLLFI